MARRLRRPDRSSFRRFSLAASTVECAVVTVLYVDRGLRSMNWPPLDHRFPPPPSHCAGCAACTPHPEHVVDLRQGRGHHHRYSVWWIPPVLIPRPPSQDGRSARSTSSRRTASPGLPRGHVVDTNPVSGGELKFGAGISYYPRGSRALQKLRCQRIRCNTSGTPDASIAGAIHEAVAVSIQPPADPPGTCRTRPHTADARSRCRASAAQQVVSLRIVAATAIHFGRGAGAPRNRAALPKSTDLRRVTSAVPL